MELTVNGETCNVSASNLAELIHDQGIADDAPGVAVAHNGNVVPRQQWSEHKLADGDEVEIITAMQGG